MFHRIRDAGLFETPRKEDRAPTDGDGRLRGCKKPMMIVIKSPCSLGCLGCKGDEILPNYMGILIAANIRIPINQPVTVLLRRSTCHIAVGSTLAASAPHHPTAC